MTSGRLPVIACWLALAGATFAAEPAAKRTFQVTDQSFLPLPADQVARYDAGFAAVQRTTRTFRADIVQNLRLQGLSKPLVSAGVLYYASPDKLLIRFSHPAGEWMLVNGKRSAIQKAGKPLEIRDLGAQGGPASHAASLLDFFHADPDRWHKDFDVSMTRAGDHLLVDLKPWMTPTSTAQGVAEIITTLQLPRYDILEMIVHFNGQNLVDYTFKNGVRNAALDPTLFKIPSP